jgi:hypothetical protein
MVPEAVGVRHQAAAAAMLMRIVTDNKLRALLGQLRPPVLLSHIFGLLEFTLGDSAVGTWICARAAGL